jgi:uncharacterized membrane protein YqhA
MAYVAVIKIFFSFIDLFLVGVVFIIIIFTFFSLFIRDREIYYILVLVIALSLVP